MISQRFKLMMMPALMVLSAAILSTPAKASLVVDIGGTVLGGVYTPGTVYTDNQAGVDSNPAVGILDLGLFLNSIASNFLITGFTATSGNTGTLPAFASMSVNANAILLPAATLPFGVDIVLSDTGFTAPPSPVVLDQTINLLSAPRGLTATATAVGFYGDSNTLFDVDGAATLAATSSLLAGVNTNVPAGSEVSGPVPYSLTTYIHVSISGRGPDAIQNLQTSTDLSVGPGTVPEPASVLLLGAGILGLGILSRRRIVK